MINCVLRSVLTIDMGMQCLTLNKNIWALGWEGTDDYEFLVV